MIDLGFGFGAELPFAGPLFLYFEPTQALGAAGTLLR